MGRSFKEFPNHCIGFGWQIRKSDISRLCMVYPAGTVPWSLIPGTEDRVYDYYMVKPYKTFDSFKEAKYWCIQNERRPGSVYRGE